MSDHVDGPRSIGEPAADVTDLFAFTSPENPARTVLAMCVFPSAGEDAIFFDFKLGKKSAKKNFDKIGDFSAAEDTIYLDQTYFKAMPIGDRLDTDTHITLDNGKLLYDGVTFAKFLAGVAPASVDDIHFIVYA